MHLVKNNNGKHSTSSFWDRDFIARHDLSGPRYTSYPTALQFHEEFSESDYRQAAARSNEAHRPLSLYFHIPFCDTVCYYCACNKIVTANHAHARTYLDLLKQEIAMQAALFSDNRPVIQLHWGGGTPTFLAADEMTELMHHTARHFHLLDEDRGEYSIEIDPRRIDEGGMSLLRGLGFNRISLGVQDFNEKVQKAVNRLQPFEQVKNVTEWARFFGFKSISYDLIYGLPWQSAETFSETIDKVIELQPNRLSLFNYAHLPSRFKTQRQILEETLPSSEEKLKIMTLAGNRLLEAGYVYIGMDHFALPGDELAIAQKTGQLHRNFQGYSTCREADLVGMGISSISQVDNIYAQNVKTLADYQAFITEKKLPLERGFILDDDDKLRRFVISQLICNNELDIGKVEATFGIRFADYFASEISCLKPLEEENLVQVTPEKISVSEAGRLLIRRICLTFDKYNRPDEQHQKFSRIL